MGKVNYGAKAAETQKRAKAQNAAASGQQTAQVGEKEYGSTPEDVSFAKNKRSVAATNENTTQISFRIPMEYKRALKTYAAQHDTTINEVFREMLRNYLVEKGAM